MKNRILFVIPSLPWPLVSGGLQALFNGIKAMESVADIYILCTLNPQVGKEKAHEELKAQIANIKGIFQYVEKKKEWSKRKLAKRICAKIINSWFSPTPSEVFEAEVSGTGLAGHSEDYYCLIKEIIERYDINMVQVEMLTCIDAVIAIPPHVKKLFVHHELGFVRNRLLFEQQSQKNSDKVLSFVGPEFHTPNKIGMEWFLNHVWGHLKQISPDYKLNIIGVWSKQTSSQWTSQYPDIHFLGFVEDLAEALYGSVMIVPILVGSGIRMKILEAMSIGVPFVTTTVGAEGIPVTDGVDSVIADTPEAYVSGIQKLEDAETRKMMVENGRKLLLSNYSFEKFKTDRIEIVKALLS